MYMVRKSPRGGGQLVGGWKGTCWGRTKSENTLAAGTVYRREQCSVLQKHGRRVMGDQFLE